MQNSTAKASRQKIKIFAWNPFSLFCCPFLSHIAFSLTLNHTHFHYTHTHTHTLSISLGSHDWSLKRCLSLPDIVSYCYSAPRSFRMTRYSGPDETASYPLWLILRSSANAVGMLVCRRAICFYGAELWEQCEVSHRVEKTRNITVRMWKFKSAYICKKGKFEHFGKRQGQMSARWILIGSDLGLSVWHFCEF